MGHWAHCETQAPSSGRVRDRHPKHWPTQALLEAMEERKKVERKFGETKRWHHLGRARYRRRWRVAIQVFTTFVVINAKRMVKLLRSRRILLRLSPVQDERKSGQGSAITHRDRLISGCTDPTNPQEPRNPPSCPPFWRSQNPMVDPGLTPDRSRHDPELR